VCSQSGASGISEILRKKTVYINLIPFSWWKLSNLAPGSIIMPKKIFDLRKKRFLTFKEILFYEGEGISSIHTKSDPYIKNHLKYIDNSPEEILDAVIQMEEKIEGKNQEQRKKLNDIFWKSVATNNNFNRINYLKNNLKLTISTNFLKNNLNLI
jgi:putative glycosyltransferase (TIGR04372 family)